MIFTSITTENRQAFAHIAPWGLLASVDHETRFGLATIIEDENGVYFTPTKPSARIN